jgi:hypothetical protein
MTLCADFVAEVGDCDREATALILLKRLPTNRLLEGGSINLADTFTFCPPLVTQDMHRPLVVAWR